MYHAQYQKDSVSDRALVAYAQIAEEIDKMFRPRNAMDVGCGGGALIAGLRAKGVDAWGIEGSEHAVELMPDRIEYHDLREPYSPRAQVAYGGYDLVTSFDVGEHIEIECHEEFSKTLMKLMGNRGWLIFGAAPEGQDGLGHVSCAHPCHYIALFQDRGFTLEAKLSEKLRAAVKFREATSFLWWVSKSLLVFRYEGR